MTAAWPNQKLTEQTARVWIDALDRFDAQDGLEAANALIRSEEWFPPVTKFISTTQAIARRRSQDRPALGAGERRVPCPPELMAQMRDCLKNARTL